MSEKLKEQVSALVDSELSRFEQNHVLEKLAAEPELQQQWARYHLIEDAIKGTGAEFSGTDLRLQVRMAIEAEETLHRSIFDRVIKPVGGLAAAASVAVVAVLAFNQFQANDTAPDLVAANNNFDRVALPAEAPVRQVNPENFNDYLVQHANYGGGRFGNSIAQIRLATARVHR